ncbi:MAG: hypothetical protein M0006_09450 [Magnetospirillum sp.]|nr:hypothetical protein [Magnetospirillum sp.]
MRRWLLAVAVGTTLSGCAYLLPGPYDDALNTPPPAPRPTPFPTDADQRAEAPYLSANFHATASQPIGGTTESQPTGAGAAY